MSADKHNVNPDITETEETAVFLAKLEEMLGTLPEEQRAEAVRNALTVPSYIACTFADPQLGTAQAEAIAEDLKERLNSMMAVMLTLAAGRYPKVSTVRFEATLPLHLYRRLMAELKLQEPER
jgi:hypothetical protein